MEKTVRPPSRATASRRNPVPRPAACEAIEPRLMFHVFAPVVNIPDVSRPVGAPQDVIDLSESFASTTDPTRVAFQFDVGRVVVELFDTAAPQTVANFLRYARSDRYDNTVIHRSALLGSPTFSPFVVQGGGYRANDVTHIVTDPPVQNEYRPSTQQRGTIAMAKQGPPAGQQPNAQSINSATAEWFFNLRDNRDILDPQNGGFTSFGQVVGNGMAIVDSISALPKTTVQGREADGDPIPLSDFPVQANPPTPPRDFVEVQYIAELPELNGTVTSSNPGLVTATLVGKSLNLNYTPGASGKSTITVNATDRNGGLVQETFDVRVGFTDVTVGEGAPSRTVTYTDADGTVGVVTVSGGTATLSFAGTGIAQTPGRNLVISGTGVELDLVTATGGSPNVTVRGRGGADNRLVVNGINGGTVRSFVGREVILRGRSNIAGGIGRLDVFQTEDAEITIGAPADPRLQPVITLVAANDTDINSAGRIGSIRFNAWTSDAAGADPDVIAAPAIGSLQSGGDFAGTLSLNGAGAAGDALGSARINGAATGTWTVTGSTGSVSIGSTAAGWVGTFGGSLRSLLVGGDLAGSLSAVSIVAARVGSMTGANVTLTQPTAAGAVALGSFSARGAVSNSNIRAAAANIGSVVAGSISNSTIYAGVNPGEGAGLPDAPADFIAPATIRSVVVRNRTGPSFVGSDIAAQTLGSMNLGVIQTANGGVPFGLAAETTASVTAADAAGARIRYARLDEPADSRESADFKVRVF